MLLAVGLVRLSLPSLSNPFSTDTVDRSGPALLTKLSDLARFQAATGSFQVVVDLEKDVDNVPSLVAGERTLFVAQGSVDSYVDFGGIAKDAVAVSGDGRRVDIVLPAAALSEARVDPEQSRVYSRQRGLLDRLGGVFSDDPTSERELYLIAQRKMVLAAGASEMQERAEDNTRSMLTGLLGTLGYSDVHVDFTPEARP
ncbi:MAG: hypothetical protein JWM64_842 [Frankiales bacterium]|nr:hypothetical protein [Frankiales bacterium]